MRFVPEMLYGGSRRFRLREKTKKATRSRGPQHFIQALLPNIRNRLTPPSGMMVILT